MSSNYTTVQRDMTLTIPRDALDDIIREHFKAPADARVFYSDGPVEEIILRWTESENVVS